VELLNVYEKQEAHAIRSSIMWSDHVHKFTWSYCIFTCMGL